MSTRPKKILQICQKANDSVSQFDLFEESARALSSVGHIVTFCLLEGDADIESLEARTGCNIVHLNLEKKDFRGLGLTALRKLYRLIKQEKFDVVITHRYKPSYLMLTLTPFLACEKFISVFHGMKQFNRIGRRLLAKLLIDNRWTLVAVSKAVALDLVDSGLPYERTKVVYNAIDSKTMNSQFLTRHSAREALQIPDDRTVIGTIGRTTQVKGHKYLLDAFEQVCQQRDDLHLVIIGGGDLEDQLRTQVKDLNLMDRVTMTGAKSDAYRYLKAMDIFTLSSLSEGLPIAMLEAICARVPVVGTNVGGIPELIPDNQFIAEPQNSQSIAVVIQRLLELSEDERHDYILKLEAKILDSFSIEKYHQNFQSLVL